MDTETQTQPGPHEVYYDDGVSRYFVATAAAWEALQNNEYADADGLNNYSLWCSTCPDSDVGDPDGYEDDAAAIAAAARLDAGAPLCGSEVTDADVRAALLSDAFRHDRPARAAGLTLGAQLGGRDFAANTSPGCSGMGEIERALNGYGARDLRWPDADGEFVVLVAENGEGDQ